MSGFIDRGHMAMAVAAMDPGTDPHSLWLGLNLRHPARSAWTVFASSMRGWLVGAVERNAQAEELETMRAEGYPSFFSSMRGFSSSLGM